MTPFCFVTEQNHKPLKPCNSFGSGSEAGLMVSGVSPRTYSPSSKRSTSPRCMVGESEAIRCSVAKTVGKLWEVRSGDSLQGRAGGTDVASDGTDQHNEDQGPWPPRGE